MHVIAFKGYLRRLRCLALVVGWTALLLGCASDIVMIDVMRAPTSKVRPMQAVKFDIFEAGSYCQTTIIGSDTSALAAQASSLAFVPDLRDFPKFLHDALNNGKYSVIESENFDARINGRISCDMELRSTASEFRNRAGMVERKYGVDRQTTITVKFSVATKSGQSFDGKVSAKKTESRTDDSIEEAVSRLQSIPLFVVDTPMEEAAEKLLRQISPHVVRERRSLATGNANALKEGNVKAQSGEWSEAARLWAEALNSTSKTDRLAALQNLAIYDEYQGKLNQARQKYEQIYAETREPKYEQAAARVKLRMEEGEWLQGNTRK